MPVSVKEFFSVLALGVIFLLDFTGPILGVKKICDPELLFSWLADMGVTETLRPVDAATL